MKGKISRGKGFGGAASYVLDKEDAELIGGTMSGTDKQSLVKEFIAVKELRPNAKKPVWHCSLSAAPGEHLTSEKWNSIADELMQRMGYDPANNQYIVVRHSDTEHDHVHIVANRIGLDGKLWHGRNDVKQMIKHTQELEQKHGLTLTPGLDMDEKAHKASLKRGEIELSAKTGEAAPKLVLQNAIDEALQDNPDTSAFIERLEAAGITPRPNVASTGRMNGFSFELDGVAFKASQLGKSYSFGQLCKRGLDYDQERDADILRAAKERSAAAEEDLAPPPDDQQSKQYRRTVDYMTEVKPGQWRFESGRHIAVKELESGGMWVAKTDTAAKAALQLALDKGWSTITVKTEDAQHSERLYRAALKVGYPPHVITLAHDQLTPERQQQIQKEFGYEQNAASQSNSSAAQQSDQRANQRAATAAKQQRRELSAANRAAGAGISGTERREPRSDLAASQGSSAAAAQERGAMAAGGREVERSDRQLEARASSAAPSNRADQHSKQPQQEAAARRNVENLDSSDQHRHADSAGASQRVHALAAPAVERRASSSEVLQRNSAGAQAADHRNSEAQQPIAPHIKAKQHAWKAQHEALQAPAYRITLTARRDNLQTYNHGKGKGPAGGEKLYTAEEVAALIPQLSRQNARGYDIYITPINPQRHYVVLDDTDPDRLQAMQQRTGIKPALVQQSSPGNLQAIIVAERQDNQYEQSNANYLVQGLNKAYGDPKFTGVVHPFRMSGFMNQKPAYQTNGRRPIVRPRPGVVELSQGKPDARLSAMMQQQRDQQMQQAERAAAERIEQEQLRRVKQIEYGPGQQVGPDARYIQEVQRLCAYADSRGWPRDWSRIDYAAAGNMLKEDNYTRQQIADAIKDNSPGIDQRKQDPNYYAQQTVEKAAQSREVQQHLRERELDGPRMTMR